MHPACLICTRAGLAIQNELGRFPDAETGGLLLGHADENRIEVLEATYAGFLNVVREPDQFAYDPEYQVHLCSILSGLYDPPLELIGVWHKHNCINPLPFSQDDEAIHRQLLENGSPCLSILFEKEADETGSYRVRVFLLSSDGAHSDVTDIAAWETV